MWLLLLSLAAAFALGAAAYVGGRRTEYVNIDVLSRRESGKEEALANVATFFAAHRFASAVIGRGHEHPEPDSAQGVWWTSNAGR